MFGLLKGHFHGDGKVEAPASKAEGDGSSEASAGAVARNRVDAVEEDLRALGAELSQARHDLEAAQEGEQKAEAAYDAAVRQHYDKAISDADLEKAQSARVAAGRTIDSLPRVIKLLEERLEAKREQLREEQRRAIKTLVESACAEVAQLFLRLLDKKAEADVVQLEMGRRVAQAQAEIQRLGGDPGRICVDYDGLRKSWSEKREA